MNKFYCKIVDIDNIDNILSEIRPYTSELASTESIGWGYNTYNAEKFLKDNPVFSKFIKDYDLDLIRVAIIKIAPNRINSIHVDEISIDSQSKFALNMCIENCVSSPTKMFDTRKTKSKILRSPLGHPYYSFEEDDCEYVTEFNLEKPTLFDATIPHQVVNRSDKIRLSISFRFGKDPKIFL